LYPTHSSSDTGEKEGRKLTKGFVYVNLDVLPLYSTDLVVLLDSEAVTSLKTVISISTLLNEISPLQSH
jgi:hypothetical protein